MFHATRNFGSTGAHVSIARQFRARQVQRLSRELQPEQQKYLSAIVAALPMQWWFKVYQDSCKTRCPWLVDALLIVSITEYQQREMRGER
jgi:hypothetical protein